jgi:hypothetical protein
MRVLRAGVVNPFRQGQVLGVECANLFEWALTAHDVDSRAERGLYLLTYPSDFAVYGRVTSSDNTILSEKIRRMGR